MVKKKIAYGERVPVRISVAEGKLIKEHTYVGRDVHDHIDQATASGSRLVMMLSLDEVEDLDGFVAAASNHCDDSKLEARLDRVFDKLGSILDRYVEDESNVAT